MKKLVVVVVVLVLLLGVAPWGVGKLAEARVNKGLDKLVAEAPYITIVERKWTSGWFRSQQEVTVELFGGWMDAIKNATKQTAQAQAPEGEATFRKIADTEGAPDAAAAEQPEAAPEATPEIPQLRFTVRNEILHGPVLWTSGIGLAQVNSKVVMSEEIRKKMIELIGTDEPVRMKTRVGLFGGGTTTLFGEGRTLKPKGEKTEISYGDFKLAVSYSGNLDSVDLKGSQPRIEIKDASDGTHALLRDITVVGENERIVGELYDSDFEFKIAEVTVNGGDKKTVRLEGIHYIVNTEKKGEFVDLATKFGSGAIASPDLEPLKIKISEVHYELSLRHLHAATVAKLAADMKQFYTRPPALSSPAEIEESIMKPFKENAAVLLKHDPEIGVDRIGLVTPEGEGFIKGLIKFKGATIEDFQNPMGVVPKVDAEFSVEVSTKMLEKFPNGATMAGAAVDSGYMKRDGDKLICKITFRDSALTINGKPTPVPGLGGPPQGQGMSPEGRQLPEGAPPVEE